MSNTLASGASLAAVGTILSTSGKVELLLNLAGDLSIRVVATREILWSAGYSNKNVTRLDMQARGNLVAFATHVEIWSSRTGGNAGAYAVIGDDGNLVIYNSTGFPVWESDSAQWDLTPAGIASHAISPLAFTTVPGTAYAVTPRTPGWVFTARLAGQVYADAPYGMARLGTELVMASNTSIHVASMSKPICATALLAMIEDWQALYDGVYANGALAATTAIVVAHGTGTVHEVVPVPLWLAPAFGSVAIAEELVAAGLATIVPAALQSLLADFTAGTATIVSPPTVPPGYAGLLQQVIAKTAVPAGDDYFLPYMIDRLREKARLLSFGPVVPLYHTGAGVDGITLLQLVTHNSTIRDGIAAAFATPASLTLQPTDGSGVTCDLWGYLVAFLAQPADGTTGYKNDDYNVLGGFVEACVGMLYDDYVTARLFADPRFSELRRYVNPGGTYYYTGFGPFQTAGNPFPDYRGFTASGGFYFTGAQITDWLYALYTGESVQRTTLTGASGPLLGTTSLDLLFSTNAWFSAGISPSSPWPGWNKYTHDGGTSVGSGSVNGNFGIVVSPTLGVVTALFCANGSIEGTGPWNAAVGALLDDIGS